MTQDLGHKEEILSNKKVQKTIDNNSLTIAMTVLQTTQYSKPIESTVRELTCNGVDSITEKNNAIKILKGEAQVSDFYIQQEGKEYEASKFNPDYYDLKWLSEENDVVLTYIENYTGEDKGFCDLLTIKDTGVGLGGDRLKGYFNLNYSTKRCNTNTLGCFGLGSKVALSTLCGSFKIESSHNGHKIEAEIFTDEFVWLTNKISSTGQKNEEYLTFGEGDEAFTAYCEKTEEKNYTIIKIPVKKANRSAFESAIENQLGYVKGVSFYYKKDYQDYAKRIDIEQHRIYETPSLIINGDSPYANLRIGIVTAREEYNPVVIDYGEIDWDQLDMIAIKCPAIFKMPIRSVQKINGQTVVLQEGVSVTPGREKIIYDENTKEFLLKSIDEVKKETDAYLHDKLKTDNFIDWYYNGHALSTGSSNSLDTNADKILRILKRLVDINTLDLKFKLGELTVSLLDITDYFKAVDLKNFERRLTYKRYNIVYTLERNDAFSVSSTTKLYRKSIGSSHNKRKDLYIISNYGNGARVATMNASISERLKMANSAEIVNDDLMTKSEKEYWSKLRVKAKIFEALHEEFLKISKNYEEVEVPEDFKANSEEDYVDENGNVIAKPKGPTPAEIRRKNQQYLFYDGLVGGNVFAEQSKKNFSIKDLQAKEAAGEIMYFFTESKNATDSEFYMTSEIVTRYLQLFADIRRQLLTNEEETFIEKGFKNIRIYRTTETNLKAISKDITAVPVEKLLNTKFSKNENDEVEIPYLLQRWMENEEYRWVNDELRSIITIDENVFELYPHIAERIEFLRDFEKHCKNKVNKIYSKLPTNLDKLDEYIRDAIRLEKYRFTCDKDKVEHIEKELSLSPYKDIFKPETKWFKAENELKLFKESHPILFHFANKNMFVDVHDSNGIVVYSKQQMLDDMKKFYPQDFITN